MWIRRIKWISFTGSRVPLYFCGARMVAMYGTGPVFDGMGLINPVYSYGDTIAVSFTCDRDMMPDPANYAAALRASFRGLARMADVAEGKPTDPSPVEAAPDTQAARRSASA